MVRIKGREHWAYTILESIQSLARSKAFPETKEIKKALEEIEEKFNRISSIPPIKTLEQIKDEVLKVWNKTKSIDTLSNRNLRFFAWVMYDCVKEVTDYIRLYEAYLEWIKRKKSTYPIKALLSAFLFQYPIGSPYFDFWRKSLEKLLTETQSRSLHIWKERCEKYNLLEEKATSMFSSIIINATSDPRELIADAGLVGQLENSRFLFYCLQSVLSFCHNRIIEKNMTKEDLERVYKFLLEPNGELRFKAQRVEIINSLLKAFATEVMPDKKLLESVCRFLKNTFGDPRVDREQWYGVDDRAKAVLLRWLAGINLEFFFKIIDRTVRDIGCRHHWPYRKAFWYAYYKKQHISEAWVVLGRKALLEVRHIDGWEYNNHGKLLGGEGVEKSHSVLLLRFQGGLTVAEWSHNAKVRLWRPGSMFAPQLYKEGYHRHELINGDYEFIHVYSEAYSWQRRVRNTISEISGIYIGDHEFRIQ